MWPKHPEKYRQIMCYALDDMWGAIATWMKLRNLHDAGLLDEATSDELLEFCKNMKEEAKKE